MVMKIQLLYHRIN